MICSHCGSQNPPGARFCSHCGTGLPEVSPADHEAISGVEPGWRLAIRAGPDQGQVHVLQSQTRIGRSPENEIQLRDPNSSRLHAIIQRSEHSSGLGYVLIDQNSTNGTFLNGQQISQPALLQAGDAITIGDAVLILEQEADWAPAPSGQAAPAYAPPAQPASKPRRRRACLGGCLALLILGLCGLTALVAGGYYLYSSGTIGQRELRELAGNRYGDIQIVNLADGAMNASLTRLDTESGEPEFVNGLHLETLEVGGFSSVAAGRYQLELSWPGGVPADGTCILWLEQGEEYSFVAVPEGISVIRRGMFAQNPDEIDLRTSPLCMQ